MMSREKIHTHTYKKEKSRGHFVFKERRNEIDARIGRSQGRSISLLAFIQINEQIIVNWIYLFYLHEIFQSIRANDLYVLTIWQSANF